MRRCCRRHASISRRHDVVKQIKGFTKQGDIELINGWVIPADYGNLTHGYCVTSYSAQSKGVDCVFVAESSESFRAADREQFYVSASRFKEALTIYTDDKGALLDAVNRTSQRPSATDLVKQAIADEQTANQIQPIATDLRGQNVCISEQTCEKAKPDQAADSAAPEDDKQRRTTILLQFRHDKGFVNASAACRHGKTSPME